MLKIFRSPLLLLVLIITGFYYKLFLFGKVPFPGDLLVNSYSPWFDYYHFPTQNPLISDIFSQFFLWKYLVADQIRNFQWPLWNPYSFTGTPLLATYHSAVLFPLNLILVLLPKYLSWGIFIYLQNLIAGISMFYLLKRWSKSWAAQVIGSLIYAFGGLMTTWTEFGTAVYGMAFLPISILWVEKFIEQSKARYLILLSLTLGAIILAGNVQVTTYSFIILGSFSLIRSWNRKIIFIIGKLLPLLLAFSLSISLTAIQLLPSYDLLTKSIRSSDSYIQEFNYGLLPAVKIFNLFIPDFFGHPSTLNYWGYLNYSETSLFIGALSLPFLINIILNFKKNKLYIFFGVLFLISLFISFDNPISQFIYQIHIPLLTLSYASRALFINIFAVAVLVTLSLNDILSIDNPNQRILKTSLISLAIYVGVLCGVFATKYTITHIINTPLNKIELNYFLNDKDFNLANYQISLRNIVIPLILNLFLLITIIFKKFIPKYQVIPLILIVLFSLDLGRYFLKFNPFVPQDLIYPSTPSIKFLKDNAGFYRVGREHAEVLPPNTWMFYGLSSPEGYDPNYLSTYGKYISFLNGGDLRTTGSGRYAEYSGDFKSQFLNLTSTKYFIGILRDDHGQIPGNLVNFKFKDAKYKIAFQDRSSVILENPNVLPRVYYANDVVYKNLPESYELISTNKTFDPFKTTILEDNLGLNTISGQGEIKIASYTPNQVVLKTNTISEQILVLNDQFESGWVAKVDDREIKLVRANLIFRAVKVPAGEHIINFSYYPRSFDLGLKISMISLGILGLVLIISLKLKKL